ncbi:hypothetical protein BH20ACI1_BH20ACI1_09040 [soil metagenome]
MKITGFALCLVNDEEEDFEPNKLYPILEPLENDPNDHLRIIDESGEDYLYPEIYFQIVQVSEQARENLLRYFEFSAV